MRFNKITVHHQAWPQMDTISAEERQQVLSTLEALQTVPRAEWARHGVRQLPNEGDSYLVPVTASLRVFFQPTAGGELEIQDIVRQELLDRHFAKTA